MGSRVDRALRDPSYLRVANIIGIKNLNSNNDVDGIERYIRENGDPYQNQLDAANQATEDIRNRSVEDLNAITIGFNDTLQSLKKQSDKRIGKLEDFIDDQRKSFDRQIASQRTNFQNLLTSQADEFAIQRDQLNGLLITSQEQNTALQGTVEEQNSGNPEPANPLLSDISDRSLKPRSCWGSC